MLELTLQKTSRNTSNTNPMRFPQSSIDSLMLLLKTIKQQLCYEYLFVNKL